MKNSDPGRGLVHRLGLAAVAVFIVSTVSQPRAEALSLVGPHTAPAAKQVVSGALTEARYGGRVGGFHGGGFRGFHGGGAAFHGGGHHAAPVFYGGGHHYGGFHGYRHAYRPHFHRRIYIAPVYYAPAYYHYPRRHCRIVWTDFGPRKICRWHRHHHWRHRWHHHRYW